MGPCAGSSTACARAGTSTAHVRVDGVCIDVTDRRLVADELRDARERLTRLVDAVDDVFFELERACRTGELRARHFDGGIVRLLCRAPGNDVLGAWRDSVHEDDHGVLSRTPRIHAARRGEQHRVPHGRHGQRRAGRVSTRFSAPGTRAGRCWWCVLGTCLTDAMADALEVALAVQVQWPDGRRVGGAYVCLAYEHTDYYEIPVCMNFVKITDQNGEATVHLYGNSRVRLFAVHDGENKPDKQVYSHKVEAAASNMPGRVNMVLDFGHP